MKKISLILSLIFLLSLSPIWIQCSASEHVEEIVTTEWPEIQKENKPWSYWWWMGSAVDKENLSILLKMYEKAGLGGMHVIPIYGVKGEEEKFIEYLSPKWLEMLGHTISEAEALGMGIDITTGTGWNFGGPHVKIDDAVAKVVIKKYDLNSGESLKDKLIIEDELETGKLRKIQALMAYGPNDNVVNLTDRVNDDGYLEWKAPKGKWQLCALFQSGKAGAIVERPAPGGEGYMANPFSAIAMKKHIEKFKVLFSEDKRYDIRAIYHDSYEYHHATWCNDFLEEFEERRGYDLRYHLPALTGDATDDEVSRVRCDYRETVSDLHLEYIKPWAQWAKDNDVLTRNQAHGSPSNIIDTYAATNIPETEINRPSHFYLPGLDYYVETSSGPNIHVMKFASSAAHIAGNPLTAAESCTWLNEHYRVSLAMIKPEIDKGFIGGINHIIYHGIPYSPVDDQWPGWLFYATTHFGQTNTIWRDFPALNQYITRCQSILQSGIPDNDILLYYPAYDLWQRRDGLNERFGDLVQPTHIHQAHEWLKETPFYELSERLTRDGFSLDFVSDQFLQQSKVVDGSINTGAQQNYQIIVVPQCAFIPVSTLQRLLDLADAGATIVFEEELPDDVPGLGNLKDKRHDLNQLKASIKWQTADGSTAKIASRGKGTLYISKEIKSLLKDLNISCEPIVDEGIQFIRRSHDSGHHYFLTSLGNYTVDGWVTLGRPARSVVIMDPLQGTTGVTKTRKTEDGRTQVYLQIDPGQSRILRTFSTKELTGPAWIYSKSMQEKAVDIKGSWDVRFIEGGPQLPSDIKMDKLESWTIAGDDEARRFGGTARYEIIFNMPESKADDWMLDLGLVRESARVSINGQEAGILFSYPFKLSVGEFLNPGENRLSIEVTNLAANRIRDLDRRHVKWKKFYDINYASLQFGTFDASGWDLVDSGLIGPVKLLPVEFLEK